MDSRTASRGSGIAAAAVSMATILLATALSPSFAWSGNALSNLGVTTTDAGTSLTVVLFNGGLVAGGVLGLVFAVALARSLPTLGGRLVGVLYGCTSVTMGLIGIFPQDRPLHVPVALGFYLLLSVTLWTDGLLSVYRGWRRRAVAGLLGGTVNIAGWVLWGATGSVQRPGLAIPELVGAIALSAWTVWVSAGLLQNRWPEWVTEDTTADTQQITD